MEFEEYRKNPYRMPEGYITSLKERFSGSASVEEESEAVSGGVSRWLRPALLMMAMFVIIAGGGSLFLKVITPTETGSGDSGLYDSVLASGVVMPSDFADCIDFYEYYDWEAEEDEPEQVYDEEEIYEYLSVGGNVSITDLIGDE